MNVSLVRVVSRTRPVFTVVHDLFGIVEGDHFDDGPRLRRVVADLVAIFGRDRLRASQTHERIAVGRRHIHSAAQQFLHRESRELRREFGAAGENAGDADFPDAGAAILQFLGQAPPAASAS